MKTIISAILAALTLISCNPKKSEAATTQQTAKPYPLETCLVSGEKLGEMGKPYEIVHEGQQIKFCCKSCLPKFEQAPSKYLSKLRRTTEDAVEITNPPATLQVVNGLAFQKF